MGLFITFEGPDGSGKSTQARLLADALRARGHDVLETREPGGTPLGEQLRTLILDPAGPAATPLATALMLSASRAQLVDEVIKPALARGRTVILDRYADSTEAYQGLSLDAAVLRELRRIATSGLQPDATVYVDVPPHVGAARMAARGPHNRLDAQDAAFHQGVRDAYRRLIDEEPRRWIVVDGEHATEDVHAEILRRLLPRFESRVPA